MALLKINDLNLSIYNLPILKQVSMQVEAGKVLGVIGESGSGKSMTASAIMKLTPNGTSISGEIVLSGQDLLGVREDRMTRIRGREIGMIFQEPMTALNPVQTIGDQVAETLLIHGDITRDEALSVARDTLRRVGLPEEKFPLTRYPHELSGGQRQRVVIAMAIANKPRLLIADEPTTALDVTTQAQVLKLLQRLIREDDMGLLLISHDLAVVSDMADDIVIMKSGAVVEQGPADELYRNMRHPYTKALFAASDHHPDREGTPQEAQDTPLLEVIGVNRDYVLPKRNLFQPTRHFRAVNEVTFDIRRGESLGLVGESGCGKSTLTRALLGLEAIQGGKILLDGCPVIKNGRVLPEIRRRMQVVFQDPYGSFNPRHKVSRLVTEPYHLLPDPPIGKARDLAVAEALESVGMPAETTDRYIHEFSGGQRQRIAIARALIIKPDLIILDEAVSALDVSIRAQILDLLADLSARFSLTYLFISHDLSVVRAITDRVLVMKSGEVVERGNTEDVFENPQHPYTKTLIEAAPQLPNVA